ncbi:MAG TPA: class I SAM-dependent methyltransferase [Gemmatales bacterium]|nr:class I SAM-dependent methyltransferase [Gemmatales bacterium]
MTTRTSSRWEEPNTVAGFTRASANCTLLTFAQQFLVAGRGTRCLDIGCGAARNAIPLAQLGFQITGADLSAPMLDAAGERINAVGIDVELVQAPMAPLPFRDESFDLVVAHGIWNLARSGAEFREAVKEAARVSNPGAGLFLFTFSRNTLSPEAQPDPGETFVFSSWNGEPQCFLTEDQLLEELIRAGFYNDTMGPLTEHNLPQRDTVQLASRSPVIYEETFVKR